jgi:hypothetical protein
VQNGGTVICGASCGLHSIFGVNAENHESDSFTFVEEVTEFSVSFLNFDGIIPEASYCSDGKTAIGKSQYGKGMVYSSGIDMGLCYCERSQKPVPVRYGRQAQYPLTVIERTPIEKWLIESGLAKKSIRGIERIPFQNGILIINHTPYDYTVEEKYITAYAPDGFYDDTLCGHKYVFLKEK